MSSFDVLGGAWRLRCPQTRVAPLVGLTSFRSVQRLAGPVSPAAYQVRYACPLCDCDHDALLTEQQLDVAPVCEPMACHYDLMTGRMDWDGGVLAGMWAQSLRRRRWPLTLHCFTAGRAVGGWPSLLRALEPDRPSAPTSMLVTYRCPSCERTEALAMTASQLALRPARG